jgi:hypothetical protein
MLSVFSCFLSKRIFLLVTLLAVAVYSSQLPEGSIEGKKSEDIDVSAIKIVPCVEFKMVSLFEYYICI